VSFRPSLVSFRSSLLIEVVVVIYNAYFKEMVVHMVVHFLANLSLDPPVQ
jgi:hypothetical protein